MKIEIPADWHKDEIKVLISFLEGRSAVQAVRFLSYEGDRSPDELEDDFIEKESEVESVKADLEAHEAQVQDLKHLTNDLIKEVEPLIKEASRLVESIAPFRRKPENDDYLTWEEEATRLMEDVEHLSKRIKDVKQQLRTTWT